MVSVNPARRARFASRALVAHTDKKMFEESRAPFADVVQFIDVRADGGTGVRITLDGDEEFGPVLVPAFAPDSATLDVLDAVMVLSPFSHVVSTSEGNLAFAAFLRTRYGLPGLSYGEAVAVTNKWRMKQLFSGTAPTAAHWLSGDFIERFGHGPLPKTVVVKPLSGSSTKGVRVLAAETAVEFLKRHKLMLVEEALDVDAELHCEGVVRGGRLTMVAASAYDHPALAPAGTNLASIHLPAADPRRAAAAELTRRITARLNELIGADFVFHVEFLEVRGELYFGEIGLRPPGGGRALSLRHFFGVDLWDAHTRSQLGRLEEDPRPRERPTYCGIVGVAADPGAVQAGGPAEADLLAVPGVVRVLPGSARALTEARLGSSVAYTHTALFECADPGGVERTLSAIRELARP